MADGISIPGVSDKYKTNDLVEALMAVERVPLKREESNLETYNKQQAAWRGMNQKMSTLRESVKTLYSFDNPFSNKLASSSDENAITVDAGREAEFGDFKIDVIQPATADRFLSDDIDKDYKVFAGKYTYTVGDKTVEFNWKGGKLSDFVSALNKRGNNIIKASLIGVSADKKSLLIESLKTGEENSLVFENEAMNFAKGIGMVTQVKQEETSFSSKVTNFKATQTNDSEVQEGMPEISKKNVTSDGKTINIGARGGFEMELPENLKNSTSNKIEFSFTSESMHDLTDVETIEVENLVLPGAGKIEYEGITVFNNKSESTLPPDGETTKVVPLKPIEISDDKIFYIKTKDGEEIPVSSKYFSKNRETGETKVSLSLKDFPEAESLVIRNSNTGKRISMSVPHAYSEVKKGGIEPKHAISTSGDAIVKYEGITMTRASNDIDDIVPHVTLHLHEKTDKSATIRIEPDTESAKDAIITFVGKYNQAVAEMNILSMNKPELISELDYLSSDEQEEAKERLGMFQGDFVLSNGKSSLQRITSSNYKFSEDAEVTMLAQLGISTNASGRSSGYSPSQMRGYLEVDEKKLDEKLKSNLNDVKNMFGFDSDGDLIIDDGIALKMDKQLTSWVQSGGIISTKTSALDKNIKDSNTKITKLQAQLDQKESELKAKYAAMQGSLNSLESQQTNIENFNNQNSNNRR